MKIMKLIVALALALLLMVSISGSTGAVTDGVLDGEGHPYVVLLLMEVGGQPAFRCSGTLLSATVLLTAGHCTNNFPGSPYTGMRVFTESDVQAGIGTTNNYPLAGPNSIEAVAWAAHPLYETAPFFVHDVGVVILQEPGFVLSEYGTLPTVNQFDAFKTKRGLQDVSFTAVGYGLQESFPDAASWKEHNSRTRYVAYPRLLQINVPGFTGDFSMLLSNNHNTGGTCFGDSGGPNFLGDSRVVAGITSFGINGNCAGTGGVFRTDRQDVLDFINSYLNP
ncbi:MAG: trypsin-like serine protease [Chloroflexi bacterium]|nr:trypsin-like serine protease [Chloroflexota bacterium]